MLFPGKAALLAIAATVIVWVVFAIYFAVQSRRYFNVNFVPLTEFYTALGLTLAIWVAYFIVR